MNVFTYSDYRKAIKDLVKERKQFEREFGFHSLAEAARVQRPYLSKVLKGSANLSSDQLYLITRVLKLTPDEEEFMQLLLEYERTSVADRRQRLGDRVRVTNDKYRDSSEHLEAKTIGSEGSRTEHDFSDYYLDPLTQIVHVALSIEQFSKQPMLLAKELHITGVQLHAILSSLERMGLTQRDGERLLTREPRLHLARSSSLYRAWRNQVKLLSAQRLNQLSDKQAYSFSAVFSANTVTEKEINDKFLKFLKSCEGTVKDAAAKQVYQMSFDLFPWTGTR